MGKEMVDGLRRHDDPWLQDASTDAPRAWKHILVSKFVGEKASALGDQVWFLNADLSGAFGSIRYPLIRRALEHHERATAAQSLMQALTGHDIVWLGS